MPTHQPITSAMADSAVEHGVAPLLDDAARRADIQGEHDALVRLAMHSLESSATVEATSAALTALGDAADALGIEIAVFKGLAIGTRWYPRPDLRPAVDVDVFIRPSDAGRLGEFVERLNDKHESRTAIESMVAEGRVFEYPVDVCGVAVDVHVDPMNLVVLTRQRELLWQRTESVVAPNGQTMQALDLEMSIIQSLLHAMRDNFADLLHLNDVALMMDDDPDWEFIESFAAAEGWTDLIRFALGFVSDTFGRPSPLPRDVSPASRALLRTVWPDRLLLRGTESLARSHRRQSLMSLLISGRRLEVLTAMLRRTFPSRAVVDDRFPGCDCPYPVALLRWRLAQRAEIKNRHAAGDRRTAPSPRSSARPSAMGGATHA